MDRIWISRPSKHITGEITLEGSKSISNRLLIIKALSGSSAIPENLSISRDTRILNRLLEENGPVLDAEDCGTAFRFLTAFLCLRPGEQLLTGSPRMLERPVQPLVDALNSIGARIGYTEKEGFPPLRIGRASFGAASEIRIPAHISSQFISALCLIAPYLPGGCSILLTGKISSLPYIEMTLHLMKVCGVDSRFDLPAKSIFIREQKYTLPSYYKTESDWSAAAFYYTLLSMAETGSSLQLKGLFRHSFQGDAAIAETGRFFGIDTEFTDEGISIRKNSSAGASRFTFDFSHCPDLAQAVMVMCAANGTEAELTGLSSLKIKETDRILAMQNELGKFNIGVKELTGADGKVVLAGEFHFDSPVSVETYQDHRTAMSLAGLSLYHTLEIRNPLVVNKSYPGFWNDLEKIGFHIGRDAGKAS